MTAFIVRFVQTILQDSEVYIENPVIQRVTVSPSSGTLSICAYCHIPIRMAPHLEVYGSKFGDVYSFHEGCYENSVFDCENRKNERGR